MTPPFTPPCPDPPAFTTLSTVLTVIERRGAWRECGYDVRREIARTAAAADCVRMWAGGESSSLRGSEGRGW